VEQVDRRHVPHQRVHQAAGHAADAGDERQRRIAALRLADQLQADAPPVPMSSPPWFAADLYKRLGPFRTLGWAEATWPLEEGRMDETTFMDDLYRASTTARR
jgi:hypothetical protein